MIRGAGDPHRVALILADASVLGDEMTAKKWGVSRRTVKRYRALAKRDSAIGQLTRERQTEDIVSLSIMRVEYMRAALEAMRSKLDAATLYEVAGSMKIVGELHTVAEAMAEQDDDDVIEPRGRSGEAEEAASGASKPSTAPH